MGRVVRLATPIVVAVAFAVAIRLFAPDSSPEVGPTPSSTARQTPSPGMPPTTDVDGFRCPAGAPMAAYASLGHHYFDPINPRRPPFSVEPDRCFRDGMEAEAAGYSKALPPEGWFVADEIYLAPVWAFSGDLSSDCRAAAHALDFAVPCPQVLPLPGEASGLPRCGTSVLPNLGCVYPFGRAFLLQYRLFPDQNGHAIGGSGLTVAAYRHPVAGAQSFGESTFLCSGARSKSRASWVNLTDDRGSTTDGFFLECPAGLPPVGGQTLLYWRTNGMTYVLGLPGTLEQTRDALTIIAQYVLLVPPDSQRA